MPGPAGEWLEGENPFAELDSRHEVKADSQQDALIFAQKFLMFTSGPGKDLLDHWTRKVRYQKIAPSASATEYAYHAGAREFVEGIHLQIEFAKNGGKSPYTER